MYGRIVQAYRFEVRFANPSLWMDGIEVDDVPDIYAEAVKVYEIGETAYQRKKAFDAAKDAETLRVDLDYVILMGGLN